jgi:drug/metabolite transporter (DMT)-like permease
MHKDRPGSGYSKVKAGRLSGNFQGAVLMVLSGLGFTLYLMANKILSSEVHPIVLAFARAGFGLFLALPFVIRLGWGALVTRRPGMLVARSLCGTLGFTLAIIAVSDLFTMSLAQFNAISFTRPLFVTLLAALVLKETVGLPRWAAVGLGFLGVLIMVVPGMLLFWRPAALSTLDLGLSSLLALGSAFFLAAAIIMVKFLTGELRPVVLLFYANLYSTVLLGPIVLFYWSDLSWQIWGQIFLMSGFGFVSQFCFISAMSVGDASFLSPLDYLRLPMSTVADFTAFRLVPGLNVWFGAAIIIVSTLYIGWRERRRTARQARSR